MKQWFFTASDLGRRIINKFTLITPMNKDKYLILYRILNICKSASNLLWINFFEIAWCIVYYLWKLRTFDESFQSHLSLIYNYSQSLFSFNETLQYNKDAHLQQKKKLLITLFILISCLKLESQNKNFRSDTKHIVNFNLEFY